MIYRQIRVTFEPTPDSSLTHHKPVPTEETSMREFVRPVAAALSIACLAAALPSLSTGSALAQAKQAGRAKQAAPPPAKQAAPPPAQEAPLKQIALTEKQIEGVLSAPRKWIRSPRSCRTTASRMPRSPRSSTASPRRTALPPTTNTTSWSTTSASCSAASIPRPRSMSAPKPSSRRRSPRSRPTRRCRPRTRRKCSPISTRR